MILLGNIIPNVPYQQLLCVNTHLLFPHNEYSSKIRLREVTKILGFIESYRQVNLCTTICGRSDVRIPVILCGDFNGSPNGTYNNKNTTTSITTNTTTNTTNNTTTNTTNNTNATITNRCCL